ncbi:MAG TPA: 3-phenylpropionate/cinnamic acid dioxygenase subunit beta [Ilumatobacteraceae bacterium]|nr:3-phenylpropionate/cinnamic acid dioxygenase subunit beta [Ilumatobacteraceae bacterium]
MTYEPSLPFDDPRHLAAHHFLVEEAAILDAGDWAAWLTLLADDIRYVMPVRVTTVRDTGYDARADMAHFDEDRYAIEKRVQRLLTDHAWTEDPPSRTRHLVTNVRTFPGDAGTVRAESSLLLFRSRGDDREAEYVCAVRRDVLREGGGGLLLARRDIAVEESVLRTQNLAVFL